MILEPKKIKSVSVPIVSPSICHEVMGPDPMIFIFWMLNWKPAFSLSSFIFIKRLFSSSLLSAIRVVSSAYLRLLRFLSAIVPGSYAVLLFTASDFTFSSRQIQNWESFLLWLSHFILSGAISNCPPLFPSRVSLVAQTVKNLPAMQEIQVWFLGWEDPLEKGIDTHSCLENSMDRGAWLATVHVVTRSQT